MLRRLFTILSVLSLLLCVATCVLWIVAQFSQKQWASQSISRTSATELLIVTTGAGWDRRAAAIERFGQIVRSANVEQTDDIATFWAKRPPSIGVEGSAGFEVRAERAYSLVFEARYSDWYRRIQRIQIPFYQAALFFGILPVVLACRWRKVRRQLRVGRCPHCNYDLRATPGRCPECGTIAAAR